MVIEGEFYKITPVSEISSFYDLELLYDIKGKNPRKEFKAVAYGVSLNKALRIIINYATNKELGKEEKVTLKKYLDTYEKARKDITNQLEEK